MDGPLRIEFRRDNLAIPHMDDAISEARRFWIVGDHHDGLAEIFVRLAQHVEHDVGILGIQVPGRFVGEHDGRFVDQCARASATRCCSPPDSSDGRCGSRFVSPSNPTMRSK